MIVWKVRFSDADRKSSLMVLMSSLPAGRSRHGDQQLWRSCCRLVAASTNVRWIRNWRTLLHMRRVDAACALTRWQHFNVWCIKIGLRQSVHVYLKNNSAKCHPDLIWNDGAFGFYEEVGPNNKKNKKKNKNNNNTTTKTVTIWDQCLIQKYTRRTVHRGPLSSALRAYYKNGEDLSEIQRDGNVFIRRNDL